MTLTMYIYLFQRTVVLSKVQVTKLYIYLHIAYIMYVKLSIVTPSQQFYISRRTRDQTGASGCSSVGTLRHITVLNYVYQIIQCDTDRKFRMEKYIRIPETLVSVLVGQVAFSLVGEHNKYITSLIHLRSVGRIPASRSGRVFNIDGLLSWFMPTFTVQIK